MGLPLLMLVAAADEPACDLVLCAAAYMATYLYALYEWFRAIHEAQYSDDALDDEQISEDLVHAWDEVASGSAPTSPSPLSHAFFHNFYNCNTVLVGLGLLGWLPRVWCGRRSRPVSGRSSSSSAGRSVGLSVGQPPPALAHSPLPSRPCLSWRLPVCAAATCSQRSGR